MANRRTEMNRLRFDLQDKFRAAGVRCRWTFDTGRVVIRQSGQVRLSFSLRYEETYQEDVTKMKEIVAKELPEATVKTTNSSNCHRPECRVTVILS